MYVCERDAIQRYLKLLRFAVCFKRKSSDKASKSHLDCVSGIKWILTNVTPHRAAKMTILNGRKKIHNITPNGTTLRLVLSHFYSDKWQTKIQSMEQIHKFFATIDRRTIKTWTKSETQKTATTMTTVIATVPVAPVNISVSNIKTVKAQFEWLYFCCHHYRHIDIVWHYIQFSNEIEFWNVRFWFRLAFW